MHPTILSLMALDIAAERVAEAERRARLLNGAGPTPRSLPRRVLERLAASLQRPAATGRIGGSTAAL
jgi:hypothetical protein